jgi:hypothetical protein
MNHGARAFHQLYSHLNAPIALSNTSTNTQNADPKTAINSRFGIPRIRAFLSAGSIFPNPIPAIANIKQISMFNPIRIR